MSFENNNKNRDKQNKKTLYQFLDKQGFYLILLLCVSIVLMTAVWASRQEEKYFVSDQAHEDKLDQEDNSDEIEVRLVEEDKEKGVEDGDDVKETANVGKETPIIESEPREKPTPDENIQNKTQERVEEKPDNKSHDKLDNKLDHKLENKTDNKFQDQDEDSPENDNGLEMEDRPTSASQHYIMAQPVMGQIGLGFADDRLVYHKTLDHWATHKGMDIHADEGAPVRAALDGEVIEVTNDTIMGITIGVRHEGDLITRYSNLSTDAMVKVGQGVKKGQVISGVGRTASTKSLEGPLVHFQVLLRGKAVNPKNYLPKID